ncbi:MAG: DNA polymerase III subunit gamma/tau [Pseudomonadota bacterium]
MAETETSDETYRVLARKYRPRGLDGLVGQDALVRTLRNAFASGRIAQAYLLTGVRGVGKTTTARIIARMLNCVGPDGTGGPTAEPCGVCDNCVAITEDRHVDVMEMDAASHTGVDNMRELLESSRYRPVSARYKVYVMDEVHMLSTGAFNALLKTLEEPPEHLKFVFATTELRKIPATILSRCQRFDLRRIDAGVLADYFSGLVEQEGGKVTPEAMALIARAADGSARDGLSILDQAMAQGGEEVTESQVRDMLGLADRGQTFDLYEALMAGDIAGALDNLERQYAAGVDPQIVLQDLLDLTHWLTRLKVSPDSVEGAAVAQLERDRGGDLAKRLSMPVLTRAWQILLKGIGEARQAPQPMQAVEMVLVRLAYAADLPSPADAIKALTEGTSAAVLSTPKAAPAQPAPAPAQPVSSKPAVQSAPAPAPVEPPQPKAEINSFADLIALAEEHREGILCAQLRNNVHLVRLEPGTLEFRPDGDAPRDLAQQLARRLETWTGNRWIVAVSSEAGEATVAEQERQAEEQRRKEAEQDPLVAEALETFPGARVVGVHDRSDPTTNEPD